LHLLLGLTNCKIGILKARLEGLKVEGCSAIEN
jgi:hypothetical protein